MENRIGIALFSKTRFQSGVATIEFALLIVPLLLMLFGVAEYGRAIYQYNTLVKSVRDATRYLSTLNPSDPDHPNNGFVEAECLVKYGNTECIGTPLVPLANQNGLIIKICDSGTSDCEATHKNVNGSTNLVSVTVKGYKFYPLPFNISYYGETVGLPSVIIFDDIVNIMRQA
jgi:Flp pilus assembly protein TadG